jgi:Flp pilus assembly protein TadB
MSNRLQQEIEELLEKIERFPPKRPLWKKVLQTVQRGVGNVVHAATAVPFPRVSLGHVALAAIVIVVVAWIAFPFTDVTRWVIIGGILLFVAAFVMSLRRQSRPPTQKYWRDRPIDLSRGGESRSWWERWRNRK